MTLTSAFAHTMPRKAIVETQVMVVDRDCPIRVGDKFTTNKTGDQVFEVVRVEPGRIRVRAVEGGPLVGKAPIR